MSNRQFISDHLVLRWLERAEGLNTDVMRSAAERMGCEIRYDRDLLDFIETYTPYDVSEIRKDLMEHVGPALAMGAKGVRYKGYFIPIRNKEAAVTALPSGWRTAQIWGRN